MGKNFLTYNMEVNGLWQEVKFSTTAIEEIFMPFLHELTDLRLTLDRKLSRILSRRLVLANQCWGNFSKNLAVNVPKLIIFAP